MTPEGLQIRENILKCSRISGHGHIPTSFSVIELILAAYGVMKHDPKNPQWPERDIFVLSKGHAALGFYCTLAQLGYFDVKEVEAFGKAGSKFGCHADRHKVPGAEVSTGSLGHGIGVATGMALAFKIKKSPRKVYTLVGDGESNEGTVWEALMVADNLKLDNLTILFDGNDSQKRCLPISRAKEKFAAFGCQAIEVDGHNIEEISNALRAETDRPKAIVARTVKGFGCKTMIENVYEWHRKSPNEEEFNRLMEELHAQAI